MKNNMIIHYDEEDDILEIRIGKPTESYFNDLGDDIFERIDKKNGKIKGLTILNFKKRTEKSKSINISLPLKIELTS